MASQGIRYLFIMWLVRLHVSQNFLVLVDQPTHTIFIYYNREELLTWCVGAA